MSATSQLTDFSDLLICGKCNESKPLKDFSRAKNRKRGYQSWCKSCNRSYNDTYVYTGDRRKYTSAEIREQNYRKIHGITVDQYNVILMKQGRRCALCGTDNPGGNLKNFAVDHCHDSGEIRGLLCRPCNMALGLLKDSTSTLIKAIKYLKSGGRNV